MLITDIETLNRKCSQLFLAMCESRTDEAEALWQAAESELRIAILMQPDQPFIEREKFDDLPAVVTG